MHLKFLILLVLIFPIGSHGQSINSDLYSIKIKKIKKLSPKPVRYLINTHIHKDHRFGNQEYVKTYPGVEIVAHPGVRDIIAATTRQYMTNLMKRIESPQVQIEAEIQRLRKEGKPGNDKVIAQFERLIKQDIHAIRREYRTVINTPPPMTFDQNDPAPRDTNCRVVVSRSWRNRSGHRGLPA